MSRKICVITGSRAEYGLLYWVIRSIEADPDLELQLVATGMHLSPQFGLTYKLIEQDGFRISKKVEMLLSSDTVTAIAKSVGLGIISFSEALSDLDPDIVLVLGDRFEIFSAVSSAMLMRLPVAHIHGGEVTEGAIDEAIRHSISKMAHLHFTATEEYRNRVIQLGEDPGRVFYVGAVGLEYIEKFSVLSMGELERNLGFKFGKVNILVTYHPVTLEVSMAAVQFRELLAAIDSFANIFVIFTKPNADMEGHAIASLIDEYTSNHPEKSVSFTSMGQNNYLSTLAHVDAVLGNSSSGIIEVPSFGIPSINIGDRQKGRIKAKSVIDCSPKSESIIKTLAYALSADFKDTIKDVVNPYRTGAVSQKITDILRTYSLESLKKKSFYDIKNYPHGA